MANTPLEMKVKLAGADRFTADLAKMQKGLADFGKTGTGRTGVPRGNGFLSRRLAQQQRRRSKVPTGSATREGGPPTSWLALSPKT